MQVTTLRVIIKLILVTLPVEIQMVILQSILDMRQDIPMMVIMQSTWVIRQVGPPQTLMLILF